MTLCKKRTALALCLVLLLTLFSGCAEQKKSRMYVTSLYPAYSLASAVETAGEIVYGKVIRKSRPVEEIIERHTRVIDGKRKEFVRGECYSTVTVEVLECPKGGLEPGDTISYREYGGETARRIWEYESTEPVSVGDLVLFFKGIDSDGVLSPDLFWRVDDPEAIYVSNDVLPAGIPNPDPTRYYPVEMSVETFLDGVCAELGTVRGNS